LFNLKGEVVGINSQIYSRSGGSMGLSFAIPIDVAMDISSQIKAGGKISRGWLGVSIQEITKDLAESFGMKNTNGALVAGVEKNGPADKSGVETGDVILKFDGKSINTSSDLPRAVGSVKPGKTVNAEVLRKGAIKTLQITVGEAPNDKEDANTPSKGAAKSEVNRIGLILNELTPQQKKKLNGRNGLLVSDSQGAAALAGVRRGDVVLGMNNTEVTTVEQFNKTLSGISNGKTVAVLILRGESTLYVPIKVTDTK
jgi:serine protease Do